MKLHSGSSLPLPVSLHGCGGDTPWCLQLLTRVTGVRCHHGELTLCCSWGCQHCTPAPQGQSLHWPQAHVLPPKCSKGKFKVPVPLS